MDQYLKLRSEAIQLNSEVAALVNQSEVMLGGSVVSFSQWKQTCKAIEKNLLDHVVRVAVVGAIKSGKSTLINSLLGEDHLKRGAGVVTSIVTRIRKGDNLRARLFFKSWDDINSEIDQALVLFPADQWKPRNQSFDIRRVSDRTTLFEALNALDAELRIARDQLNANVVLLMSYLKGYETIKDYVGAESIIRDFKTDQFALHRSFVGDDALAVYLRDIALDIPSERITGNIEIADCQGSDSANPLHMAMIQDYLLKAHLIIYVISSRTGLRQADIRFLSIIKKMGISANIIFVCNCDLNEHGSLADLQALINRINDELGLLVENPGLFSLSALYNLFSATEAILPEREAQRLSQWRKTEDMVFYSDSESRRLEQTLTAKLTLERSSLLLHNQLEHLDVISTGLHHWLRINRDMLCKDSNEAAAMAARIQDHQKHIEQVRSMIHSTLEGAVRKIKMELRKKIDSFFDLYSGPILSKTMGFIRNHDVDLSGFRDSVSAAMFTRSLYLVFQSYRQAVDTFMTETINPEIIGYLGREEVLLIHYFQEVAEPYKTMVRNTLAQFENTLEQFGFENASRKWTLDLTPDLDAIKNAMGICLPPAAAVMRYSAQIKTDAIIRLGFYSILRFIRKALKKTVGGQHEEGMRALRDGVRRMKKETERSMIAHFTDYRENIKFQYMMRLADIAGVRLYEALTEHFHDYLSDLKTLIHSIGNKRTDKEQIQCAMNDAEKAVVDIKSRIEMLKRNVMRLRNEMPT